MRDRKPTPGALEESGERSHPRERSRVSDRLPLVAALVPDPDVWRVSGAGRTLLARRRQDGRIAWASLAFDLKRPASLLLFGNLESEEGAFEEVLDALYRIDDASPMVGGSDRLAARFAHCALAWSRARKHEFLYRPHSPAANAEDGDRLLSVFARPRGDGLASLSSPRDGLCAPGLLKCCEEEADAALPLEQALAVRVRLSFRLANPTAFRKALEADPDFPSEEDGTFSWRPELASGRRLGLVLPEEEGVSAETVSLELGGRLCARLKRLAEGAAELVSVSHEAP